MDTFQIKGEYIELIKLIKAAGMASSGSDAKLLVSSGNVMLNGKLEERLRAKVRVGDKVELEGKVITVS